MLVYFCFCLILSGFVISTEFSADYIGDIDNFHINYRLRNDNVESQLQQLLKDAPDRVVSMKTAEQEEYKCVLPVHDAINHEQQILEYKGPSPAELIKPLVTKKAISFLGSNGYWFYDLAHGNYILQYHEDREKKEKLEIFLGNYRADQSEEDAKTFNQFEPPKTKIRDVEYPYYPVQYRYGTVCDLTKKPRETTVMYVCHEQVEHIIYSVTEVSTCNYELIVLTKLLCVHPAFQSPATPEHEIHCYAPPNADHAKPLQLRDLERQVQAEDINQYSSSSSAKSSLFDNYGSQEHESTQGDDSLLDTLKQFKLTDANFFANYRKNYLKLKTAEQSPFWKMIRRIGRLLTEEDYENVREFWEGKNCFIGGNGYWKYEFCYGNKVTQFHSDGARRTREIVLGEWNEEAHLQWFRKNRESALILDGDNTIQVSNYYTNGDFCEETGKTRVVEVRIKCRNPPESEDPSTVFLAISEPTTCHYILTLQAGIFCEGLQYIDRTNGLMLTLDPETEKLITALGGESGIFEAVKEMFKDIADAENEEEDDQDEDED